MILPLLTGMFSVKPILIAAGILFAAGGITTCVVISNIKESGYKEAVTDMTEAADEEIVERTKEHKKLVKKDAKKVEKVQKCTNKSCTKELRDVLGR